MKQGILISLLLFATRVLPQMQPAPRHLEEITFDTRRHVLILFGGGEPDITGNNFQYNNHVFEWDGKIWKDFHPATAAPGGLAAHVFLYNEEEQQTVLIGHPVNHPGQDSTTGVWTWNGKEWKRSTGFCPLSFIEAAYDAGHNRVLAYGQPGGTNDKNSNSNHWELWEFKTGVWKKLSDSGPVFPSSTPYELCFDRMENALLLPFWTNGKPVIWEWKNEKWEEKACPGICPPARDYYALAYHEKEKATYLFGGRAGNGSSLNDFWKWDGKEWTRIESVKMPLPRIAAKLEYADGGLFLYGGVTGWGLTNELWQWKNGGWNLLNPAEARDRDRTEKLLLEYIAANPEDPGGLRSYANLLKNADRFPEAEAYLKKAFSLRSGDFYFLFDLLQVLYTSGKNKEAETLLDSSISAGNLMSYARLGSLLTSIGKIKDGMKCFQKAISSDPSGINFYNLGRCYAVLKDADKAFESLQKSVALGFNARTSFENDPDLLPLQSDARWNALKRDLK